MHVKGYIAASVAVVLAFPAGAGIAVLAHNKAKADVIPAEQMTDLSWHDGYHHFVVTVGPATPTAPNEATGAASPAAVVRALSALPGIKSVSFVWGDRYEVATTFSASKLQGVPGVRAVLVNRLFAPLGMPVTNDPNSAGEWYLDNVGLSLAGQPLYGTPGDSPDFALAWDRSTGAGVTVAVIDTGVDTANPDLAGAVLPASRNFLVSPPSAGVTPPATSGEYYHGTNVAGVIAAQPGNGFAAAEPPLRPPRPPARLPPSRACSS